jgi:hypothetical protein
MFFVIARSFGLRVMLYLVVLWGTSDFSIFGTNLMGATLRQDWLVALGLGACALKSERPFLGGVLVAYAGMVRLFPSQAALFLAVPIVWFAVDIWREHHRIPSVAEIRAAHRPALRGLAGALACVVGLLVFSSAVFGVGDNWGAWQQKTDIHATGPSANLLGLHNVIAFRSDVSAPSLAQRNTPDLWSDWARLQNATFSARQPLYYLAVLLAIALALIACRGRTLQQVFLIGLLLVPFYSYLPNNYFQFVFLLPLAVAVAGAQAERDRGFAFVVIVLALMAVGQAFTLAETWNDLRYTDQSDLLVLASAIILFQLARESWRAAPLWKKESGAGEKDAPASAG